MNIPKSVLKALQHVKQHYPNVCIVVFNTEIRWQYFDEDFNAPKFGKEIDIGILEDAVYDLYTFPCVFQL